MRIVIQADGKSLNNERFFWLTDDPMARLQPSFPRVMADRGLMIVACQAALFS
jgi:hypothetical protein